MRPWKSPVRASMRSPKKSLSCVLAISTAMPLVKPTTTGRGGTSPRAEAGQPEDHRMTPAIIVHMNSPSTPCLHDRRHDDDERAGRPPI
jgi:hypothetical protein